MLFSLSGTEHTLTADILEFYDMSGGQRCHQENLLSETSLKGQDVGRTWRKKKPLLCSKDSITNQTSWGTCSKTRPNFNQTKSTSFQTFPSWEMQAFSSPLPAAHRSVSLPLLHDPALPGFPGEQTSLPTVSRGFPKTPPMRKGKEKLKPDRSEKHLVCTEYYLI